MASRLWLALVLFQLASAVPAPAADAAVEVVSEIRDYEPVNPLVPRDNVVVEGGPDDEYANRATNENSPLLGGPGREQRVGVDYMKALGDPTKQPPVPAMGTCNYAYERQDKNGPLTLWNSGPTPLADTDVRQGMIGDCGLGSAIAAAVASGHTKLLQSRVKANGSVFEYTLSWDGKDYTVRVDDQLPVNVDKKKWECGNYMGFNPGGAGKSNYVSLTEKAVAKLFDAVPALKYHPDIRGYLSLHGVRSEKVFEVITGKRRKKVGRSQTGLDSGILRALERCVTGPEPCVVDTPATRADQVGQCLGPKPADGQWRVPLRQPFVSAVFSIDKQGLYHCRDFDLADARGHEAVNTLVFSHAWAIDPRHSVFDPRGDRRKAKVRLLNPWGVNAKPWTKLENENALDISLLALANLVEAVETVESI